MSRTVSTATGAIIRPVTPADIEPLVDLSLRAWAPVDDSFKSILGAVIYRRQYPDWPTSQAEAVRRVCTSEDLATFVIELEGTSAGFVAVGTLAGEPSMGKIDMIAVDPTFQRRGLARDLMSFAVDLITERGMSLATIFTGGDPSHEPARRLYESTGFTALRTVRYYRALDA